MQNTADVLRSVAGAWFALQCPPPAPPLRGSLSLALQPQPNVMLAESRESAEPINIANLRVNQRPQINEDTVKPSLAA